MKFIRSFNPFRIEGQVLGIFLENLKESEHDNIPKLENHFQRDSINFNNDKFSIIDLQF